MRITVIGTPAPQGSKRHVGNGVMVESSKKVKPWRQDVKYAALEMIDEAIVDPVHIRIAFYLVRPRSHYRTGANAALFRDSAPEYPAGRPDLDKLLRSTLDGLGEAGVWRDDAQVVTITALKLYADDRQPGAAIDIWAGPEPAEHLSASHTRTVLPDVQAATEEAL